jgi:hypothetical protein
MIITAFNPLNAQLNPICHLLALLGVHYTFHVSELRVNMRNKFSRELLFNFGGEFPWKVTN